MGVYKAEKPMILKELIWPALMIMSSTNAFEPYTLSQDASNPASHPTVYRGKGPLITVLKVLEPSPKSAVDVPDDHCQTVAIAAPGLGADGVFEFLEALSPRLAGAVLKVVPKKIKSLAGHWQIHHPGLLWVQGQTAIKGQYFHRLQGLFG